MKKANKVKSVAKAMTIFSELAKLGKPISLSLLSNKTRMNISTVYRILNTMTELGYVQQNEKDLYCLGSYAYEIADLIHDSFNFKKLINPYLNDIVATCKETANLSIFKDFQVIYIDQVESPKMLKILTELETPRPAYCTGPGKVFLSHLKQEEIKKYMEETEFFQHSKNTITEPSILFQVLKRIKKQNYAVEIEEYEEGVLSIAAPILLKKERLQGTISVSAPCSRINSLYLKDTLIPLIKNKAKEISYNLSTEARTNVI